MTDMELSDLPPLVKGVQSRLVPPHWRDEAYGAGMEAAWRAWEVNTDRSYVAHAIRLRTIDFLRTWQRGSRHHLHRRRYDTPLMVTSEEGDEMEHPGLPRTTDDEEIEVIDLRQTLDGAVDNPMSFLTEGERETYRLYVLEEMTLKQVGEIMGVTESRVSQLFTSLSRKLRSYLDVDG